MFCQKCGQEDADDSRFCRRCGAGLGQTTPVRMQGNAPGNRRAYWIAVAVAAAVLILIAQLVGVGLLIGYWAQQQLEGLGALEIIDSSMTYDASGYAEVVGTVENTGNSSIFGCVVEAKFYDSEDELIDTESEFVQRLGPGKQARFVIPSREKGAVRYEVAILRPESDTVD